MLRNFYFYKNSQNELIFEINKNKLTSRSLEAFVGNTHKLIIEDIYLLPNITIDTHGSELIIFILSSENTDIKTLIFQVDSHIRIQQLNSIILENKISEFNIEYVAIVNLPSNILSKDTTVNLMSIPSKFQTYISDLVYNYQNKLNIEFILNLKSIKFLLTLTRDSSIDINIISNIDYKDLLQYAEYDPYLNNLIQSENFAINYILNNYGREIFNEKPDELNSLELQSKLKYYIHDAKKYNIVKLNYKKYLNFINSSFIPVFNSTIIDNIIINDLYHLFNYLIKDDQIKNFIISYLINNDYVDYYIDVILANRNISFFSILIKLIEESDYEYEITWGLATVIKTGDIFYFNEFFSLYGEQIPIYQNNNHYYIAALNSSNVDMIQLIVLQYNIDQVSFLEHIIREEFEDDFNFIFEKISLPILEYIFGYTLTELKDNRNVSIDLFNEIVPSSSVYPILLPLNFLNEMRHELVKLLINDIADTESIETIEYMLMLTFGLKYEQTAKDPEYQKYFYKLLETMCIKGNFEQFKYFFDKIKKYIITEEGKYMMFYFDEYRDMNDSEGDSEGDSEDDSEGDSKDIIKEDVNLYSIVPDNRWYVSVIISGNIDFIKYFQNEYNLHPIVADKTDIILSFRQYDIHTSNKVKTLTFFEKYNKDSIPVILLSIMSDNVDMYLYLDHYYYSKDSPIDFDVNFYSNYPIKESYMKLYSWKKDSFEHLLDTKEDDQILSTNDRENIFNVIPKDFTTDLVLSGDFFMMYRDYEDTYDEKLKVNSDTFYHPQGDNILFFAKFIDISYSNVIDYIINRTTIRDADGNIVPFYEIDDNKRTQQKLGVDKDISYIIDADGIAAKAFLKNYLLSITINKYNLSDKILRHIINNYKITSDEFYNIFIKYGRFESVSNISYHIFLIDFIRSLLLNGYLNIEQIYQSWKNKLFPTEPFEKIGLRMMRYKHIGIKLIKLMFKNGDFILIRNVRLMDLNINFTFEELLNILTELLYVDKERIEDISENFINFFNKKFHTMDMKLYLSVKEWSNYVYSLTYRKQTVLLNYKLILNTIIVKAINGYILQFLDNCLNDKNYKLLTLIVNNFNKTEFINDLIANDYKNLFQYFIELELRILDVQDVFEEDMLHEIILLKARGILKYITETFNIVLKEEYFLIETDRDKNKDNYWRGETISYDTKI